MRWRKPAIARTRLVGAYVAEWLQWGIFTHTPRLQPSAAERRKRPFAAPLWNRWSRPLRAISGPRQWMVGQARKRTFVADSGTCQSLVTSVRRAAPSPL